MAGRGKKAARRKRSRGGWIALGIIAALLVALGGIMGYAALNANTVHVRYAEVSIANLPQTFEGCRILFASDIDLCGMNTPEKAAALFSRLQALNPDILLLGGDYTSAPVLEILNSDGSDGNLDASALKRRSDFFQAISDFDAPLGKYAVAGDNDAQTDQLSDLFIQTGVTPLFNDHAEIQSSDGALHLVGINADASGVNFNGLGNAFSRDDCVIAFTHSPGLFPQLLTAEAGDAGSWADLILAGHTHGGQIRLFNRNMLQLTSQEEDFLYGWYAEGDTLLLTTSGVGCEGANLRLGSEAEVWLITLRRKTALPDLTASFE